MNGQLIGGFNLSTRKAANGIWTLNEAAQRIQQDIWPTVPDPSFANVTVLLHGNSVINENRPLNKGSSAGIAQFYATTRSTSDICSTTGSLFNGSSFRVMTAGNASGILVAAVQPFGTQDFTLEGSISFGVVNVVQTIFDWRPFNSNGAYPTIYLDASGKLNYYTSSAIKITTSSALSAGTKYQWRYVRSGGNLGTLSLQGVSVGTWADTTSYSVSSALFVCQSSSNTTNSGCSLNTVYDEIRVTIGIARPTTYTPDTARFPDY